MASTLASMDPHECSGSSCESRLKLSNSSFNGKIPPLLLDLANKTLMNTYSNISLQRNNTDSTQEENGGLSTETIVALIVLFSLTFILSVVGNILVVIVFVKGSHCKTDIRPFLVNLAIADLIMALLCMPFTVTFVMLRNWIFTAPMCPIVLFMQTLSVSASVFTNMAIGIDRFRVVTFPLQPRLTTERAKYTIGGIWFCAVALSSVQLVVSRQKVWPGKMIDCEEVWDTPTQRKTFTLFVFCFTYAIPLVILAVTYSIVSILLWKRTIPGNANEGRDYRQLRAKIKVIKMLAFVVITFALCWLPLHTFSMVTDYNPEILAHRKVVTLVYYLCFWLAMSNSCTNPIIYGFTNDKFRLALASLCYGLFPFCVCLRDFAKRHSTVRIIAVNTMQRHNAYRNGKKGIPGHHHDDPQNNTLTKINRAESPETETESLKINGKNAFHKTPHTQHHCHRQPCFRSLSDESKPVLSLYEEEEENAFQESSLDIITPMTQNPAAFAQIEEKSRPDSLHLIH